MLEATCQHVCTVNAETIWAQVLTAICFVMMLIVVNIFIAIVCEYFTEVMEETMKLEADKRLLGMRGAQYTLQTPMTL